VRRLTVCILEGTPKLPESVKVVAGLSGEWNELVLAENLAMAFNFLRHKLEQEYKRKIPIVIIQGGQSVTITPKVWELLKRVRR